MATGPRYVARALRAPSQPSGFVWVVWDILKDEQASWGLIWRRQYDAEHAAARGPLSVREAA